MNRRGFLKLCSMAVVVPSLPAPIVTNNVASVVLGKEFYLSWGRNLFDCGLSTMVLTNFTINDNGSIIKKELTRWSPQEAA